MINEISGRSVLNLQPQLANHSSEFSKLQVFSKLQGDVLFKTIRFVEHYLDDEGNEVPAVRKRAFIFGGEYVCDLVTYSHALHVVCFEQHVRISDDKFFKLLELLAANEVLMFYERGKRFAASKNFTPHYEAIINALASNDYINDYTVPFPRSFD